MTLGYDSALPAGGSPMTTVAAEEADLVARVAAGDRGDPLIDLYQRYAGRLYGLGVRLLGDEGSAEELVQETFVRLWRGAGRYDPAKASVRTYVFTIARRAAVDFRRRPASRPIAGAYEQDATLEAEVDEPAGESYDRLLLSLDVRDALRGLSLKHREVLELHFDEDLTQTQMAERLGVPLGTVKTRAYYALKALRLELEERGLVD